MKDFESTTPEPIHLKALPLSQPAIRHRPYLFNPGTDIKLVWASVPPSMKMGVISSREKYDKICASIYKSRRGKQE